MALEQALVLPLRRAAFGLMAMALGTSIVASGLAQLAFSPGTVEPPVNRTSEALAGYQDMTPPGAAR